VLPPHARVRWLASAGLAVLAVTALAAGCSDDEADAPGMNSASISAADFSFTVDGTFTPGMNEISFTNTGGQTHHAQLIALDEGKTMEDVGAVLASGDLNLPEWAHYAGGGGAIEAGGSTTTVMSLKAGTYVLLCVIPDPADGVAHAAKGMVTSFTVEGEDNGAKPDEADITMTAGDYFFDGPDTIDAGDTAIAFKNGGAEPHEMAILHLDEGATVEQYLGTTDGPPPGAFIGGVQGIDPGGEGIALVDLEAGDYALLCFFPNKDGAPHFTLGMVKPFKVE
jgi:uncharacterized cupredoxin-like copper-binding protein